MFGGYMMGGLGRWFGGYYPCGYGTWFGGGLTNISVSYTHLTLPTILRV